MEVPVYNLVGSEIKKVELPKVFQIPIRQDLIKRLFFYQYSHRIQPKGRYPYAGRDVSAEYFGVGLGISRIPRYKTQPLRGMGAVVAMARGGRRPHSPTVEKKIYKRINKKELKLAVASAISSTAKKDLVLSRGHIINDVPYIPLVVDNEVSTISKTSEIRDVLMNLGVWADIERVRNRVKIVGGKAAWRGRRRKLGVGPLIVYLEDKGISMAVRNLPGVEAINVRNLSLIHLAPGGDPGRLTIWVEDTLKPLDERFRDIINRYVMEGVDYES
ncbi:TPA: 50S ribosomal protein L4 [Candidatus Geothermarchaeota archaeon]|nr:50S ribosomal protein L4 [Candidatus Geothermarchaeota archaeon]HIQ13395.1 50S ribosomal protein L4 [Thermoprotei archaeon]